MVSAAGALLLSTAGADATYAADVLPGFLVLGVGVGPMFVAISVGAMADVPHDDVRPRVSGVMMTGHEVGAALGVALLTAVAGDLTTRAGLVAGHADAFVAVAVLLLALLVPDRAGAPSGVAAAPATATATATTDHHRLAYPLGVCYVPSPRYPLGVPTEGEAHVRRTPSTPTASPA